MVALIFIVVAAVLKAASDTLKHHFGSSVFKKLKPEFWNPDISNTKELLTIRLPFLKPIKTKYRLDAWHLSNSLMIVSFTLAYVFSPKSGHIHWLIDFAIAGVLFILTFNTFYNKVFLGKKIW